MNVINTNIKSLVSQNAMVKNNRDLANAMQELSTGKRINSAKDDAAGLAITSRMTSQITGLNQAIRNGNDSVSMLQTTEGAMIEMTNMLQRMRELAIQSSNDTYTAIDRGYLDLEFQQLKAEVNRITKDTEWNGMPVLNGTVQNDEGTFGKFEFQVGANQGQIIMHTIANMGFRDDAKTSFATTTANASGVHQVSTLTLSGTYKAGDTISFSVGGEDKTYSVLEEDLTSSSNDTNLASIAAKLLTTAETPMGLADQADVTASGSVLTFTAATAGTEFSTSTATDLVDTGVLKNTRALTILNNTDSNASISELDVAINRINTERAGIGAVVNRLTYAMDNLTNVSQNTSESRSRIMDADYAKASSELARTQIISQAATAMLAQANQQPQTVMKLLQG
ncbi:MAG: flagellin [Limnohabitans sp.]|jgi:flagellin|uniref:flagellin N-terminal helical domain-containing protein n=1 Tax=Limnohabitans sp. TaxID=1907725 RepID=UPI0025F5A6A3|nr:flagellin [Limnohabitans sp.]MCO4088171.1 flagellin [Limnohabitans sp.]